MRNRKRIAGVRVRTEDVQCNSLAREVGADHLPNTRVPRVIEVHEAHGDRVRFTVEEPEGHIVLDRARSGRGAVVHGVDPEPVTWEVEIDGASCRTTRNGEPADPARGRCLRDPAMCAVLRHLYGQDFVDYEHAYAYREGDAFEAEGDD